MMNILEKLAIDENVIYLYGCLTGSTSIIFSGLRSAWINPSCLSFNSAVRTYKDLFNI